LPTAQTFDHNYTASYYLHELRTPESYRGDNYSDAGGTFQGKQHSCYRLELDRMQLFCNILEAIEKFGSISTPQQGGLYGY
ncbi:hypothetical protein, partial [Paracidovorax oryzae]|uniref:hypothetical protein n=1 Tax=Paracidovorax oryzae TaxID=862720 RepID=UPI0035CF8297